MKDTEEILELLCQVISMLKEMRTDIRFLMQMSRRGEGQPRTKTSHGEAYCLPVLIAYWLLPSRGRSPRWFLLSQKTPYSEPVRQAAGP